MPPFLEAFFLPGFPSHFTTDPVRGIELSSFPSLFYGFNSHTIMAELYV